MTSYNCAASSSLITFDSIGLRVRSRQSPTTTGLFNITMHTTAISELIQQIYRSWLNMAMCIIYESAYAADPLWVAECSNVQDH